MKTILVSQPIHIYHISALLMSITSEILKAVSHVQLTPFRSAFTQWPEYSVQNMELSEESKKSKKKPSKIEEMTKEQIRQAIVKKRECNAKAQKIVENLLEKGISEDYFVQCLPDINQSHLDDVIEERAIIQLCGYPICCNNLSKKDIPKQKYRISMKTNKVYDITARKSFCSNSCYNSAMYIKKQMLTSPLWFREYEDVPKFHLLPVDTVGKLGQEVDVSIIETIKVKPKTDVFTSISDFTSASLNEMSGDSEAENSESAKELDKENDPGTPNTENAQAVNKTETNSTRHDEIINSGSAPIKEDSTSNDEALNVTELNKNHNIVDRLTESKEADTTKANPVEKKPVPNPLNIVGEIVEKPERKIDPILTDTPNSKPTASPKSVPKKPQPSITAVVIEVEKCLAEWFTLDTLIYLFGETKVKEMVTDKGECIKEYLNNYAKGIFYTSNTYDQYQALCRKLNMLELEDRRFDSQTLQRETKPLPDYSMLQEESKRMQLKVKAFLTGTTDIQETNVTADNKTPEDGNVTQLPLVDKNAQNALRRKIVCQHLNKVLPDLLQSLSLLTLSISSDVRLIVNTFKLKANNIMFKPLQWTLIAIVVIKLLSLRDARLAYLLESPTAFQHMQLLLLSYKQDGGYLDRLISWLTDIDRLLDTNDIQLTVE